MASSLPDFPLETKKGKQRGKAAEGDGEIAIVGFALRFPGNIFDEQSLWAALKNGKDCITQIPENRWPVQELKHPDRAEPGRSVTFAAGVLSDIGLFDADFFGISPREAGQLDPQQRLLLELSYEAMENAGVPSRSLAGSRCGVYVGISGLEYGQQALDDMASISAHLMTGNALSMAANRLSYVFDLRGPSLAVDTACSSSLTALHHACQALRAGEIPSALVGGVNLLLHPYSFVGFSKASMLSKDGRCRPFDAAANGYVRSEGGAVFLLKPLSGALRDGDRIHAVIEASGINVDGSRKTGITIPSIAGQTELMRDVLAKSGLSPHEVDFIEAHGTGTAVGDPVEAASIGAVYGKGRVSPLPVSSVKANLGHMEAASGMAGLAKIVLALKNRALPPTPFAYTPNPRIDFQGCNIRVVSEYTPLGANDGRPLTAALNSFGFGGSNAHVILREFRPRPVRKRGNLPVPPLRLSAGTDAALRALAGGYARLLREAGPEDYYNVAHTAAFRRDFLEKRLMVSGGSPSEVAGALRSFSEGSAPAGLIVEEALPEGDAAIAFIYSGNGAQWSGMGRALLDSSPEFAGIMAELDEAMRPFSGFSLLEALRDERPGLLDDTAISQPLLFAMQVAVTMLLRRFGVLPKAVMGHSVGEVAAAWASGALSGEQAIRVICARSQAQGLTRGGGRMAAVGLGEKAARELIEMLDLAADVEIAGVNSPKNVTLSGKAESLLRLGRQAADKGIFFRQLDLDYAFHSKSMDGISGVLSEKLRDLPPGQPASAAFVSSVTGKALAGENLDREYWWRNIRLPVRFHEAMTSLLHMGCRVFVEIGPHAVLLRYIGECAAAFDAGVRALPTLLRGDDGLDRIVEACMRAHAVAPGTGFGVFFPRRGARASLPAYPWQKARHAYPRTIERVPERRRVHPLLGWPLDLAETAWENILDPAVQPWLHDHKVGGAVVFPGAGYVEMALAAARAWLGEERLALESLDIAAPMVFDGDRAQCVRCRIDSRDGSFQISSRPRLDAGDWTPHASGRILPPDGRAPRSRLAACGDEARRMDGSALYAAAGALGLDYGPAFRLVQSVAVAGDALDIRCLPVMPSGEDYCLHPAVLDACFHSLVALGGGDDFIKNTAFLPTATGRIERFRQGRASRILARVKRGGQRVLTASFELFDVDGNLLAAASECRFRTASLMAHKGEGIMSWKAVPRLAPHPAEGLSSPLPSVETLARRLETAFGGSGREKWYMRTLPLLESMVLSFALEVFRGPDRPQAPGDPYASWLERLLRSEDLLRGEGGSPAAGDGADLPSAGAIWRDILRDAPESLPQLLPLGRVGLRLADVLAGRLAGRELLEEIRGASVAAGLWPVDPVYLGASLAIKELLAHLAAGWPAGRRLRILEFSDFDAELTEKIAGVLNEDRFQHVLALASPAGVEQAASRCRGHASVTVARFDAAQWEVARTPEMPELFDVVVVNQVLHRAVNLEDALTRIRQKMAAGGLLLLTERYPDWSADFLEGLDPAWWREDASGAHGYASSLISPADWVQALAGAGFADCRACAEPAAGALAEGAYIVMAKSPPDDPAVLPAPAGDSWLLLADGATLPLAAELCGRMESTGQRVVVAREAEESRGADFAHVVFMRGAADAPDEVGRTLSSLLECVRGLAGARETGPRLWVVTRNGAPLAGATAAPSPAQCAVWGFGRVVMNERPGLRCTLVDVSGDLSVAEAAGRLQNEFLHPDGSNEILLAPEARQLLMLQRDAESLPPPATEDAGRFRLDVTTPGRLRNLVWRAMDESSPAAGEIEARVAAVGLNFRDVMLAMGLLPEHAVEDGFAGVSFGLEFSGIVTRVGNGVSDFAPGDAVVGFAPACFASHVITPARAVTRLPEHWSFEAAAAAPTVFFTAYYALKHLARLQPGESVLIHGAAGGIGLAAIQVARHLGADVYATAGSDEKRDMLRLLGLRHIFDSRSLAFERDILDATNGAGVDAALNSLAGEAMRRSLAVLKPFGRFIELGKRDFVENTALGLRPFKENISYFAVDADRLLTGRPQLAADVFREVMQLFHDGVFTLSPHMTFGAGQVEGAFRVMQQSRHLGKIVISCYKAPPVAAPLRAAAPPPALDGASSWLVTGGLSGFGLATARRLADMGARQLVLVGRRGPHTPGAKSVVAEFAARGVTAVAESCDMADAAAVDALIRRVRETMPRLGGIVHAAAIFDDRTLDSLDAKSLEAVLAPKLAGAWHLHRATLGQPLDHFVLYSSVSVALGNPGQANYVAANAGLEGLALLRRSMGLPASCVAWGPIGDAGYLEGNAAVKESLERRLGRAALTSAEALDRLGAILAGGEYPRILANLDWGGAGRILPQAARSRFTLVSRGAAVAENGDSSGDIHTLLAGKTPDEAADLVRGLIIEEVAQVLSMKAAGLDPGRTLQSLGLDSLMAVELAAGLEQRFGIALPVMMLQDSPTIDKVTARITARLTDGVEDGADGAVAGNLMEIARKHGEDFSDGDLASLAAKTGPEAGGVEKAS